MHPQTKRIFSVILFTFFVFVSLYSQSEKTPVIFVDNFKNLGKGNDTIGETLKRSLRLIVDLTRKYEVVYQVNVQDYLNKMNLKDVKAAQMNQSFIESNFVRLGMDEILYGTFRPYDNGDQVEIRIIVLTMTENKVKFDKTYRSATDADIFDTIDKIGLDLASVLVGRRLGIGSLIVNNFTKNSDIFVDGIKSGQDHVAQNTAIAGLKHTVEIKTRDGKTLYSREFEIQDRGFYDLTYGYDEFVEVIDESKETNKMKKEEYARKSSASYFKHGPVAYIGGGALLWGGYYIDWENITLEAVATFIPRIPNYVFDWYIGFGVYGTFYAFRQDSAVFNFYLRIGVMDYYGIELSFPDNDPYAYIGAGIQIMPDWSFMPKFMRNWKFFIEGGTMQDAGIFWKNFSAPASTGSGNLFQNSGWPMLTVGVKF